jgi:hypothetical protein
MNAMPNKMNVISHVELKDYSRAKGLIALASGVYLHEVRRKREDIDNALLREAVITTLAGVYDLVKNFCSSDELKPLVDLSAALQELEKGIAAPFLTPDEVHGKDGEEKRGADGDSFAIADPKIEAAAVVSALVELGEKKTAMCEFVGKKTGMSGDALRRFLGRLMDRTDKKHNPRWRMAHDRKVAQWRGQPRETILEMLRAPLALSAPKCVEKSGHRNTSSKDIDHGK